MRYVKVSQITRMFDELEDIKEELNEAYEKVCVIEDNKLGVEDLLFKKICEYYEEYKKGKLKENDEVDLYEGVILCDKYADEYKLDVSKLFKDMIEEGVYGYYAHSDFHDSYDIFPKDITVDIEENAINLKEYLSECASYIYIQTKGLSEMLYNHITAEYTPEEVVNYYIDSEDGLNYWDGMTGAEIYDIFDYESFMNYYAENYDINSYEYLTDSSKMKRFAEYLVESKEIDKLIGEFIEVRNRCFETYYIISKIEANEVDELELSEEEINYYSDFYNRTLLVLGKDIMKEYKKLSMKDFEMDNDFKLHIINNADVYEMLGVNTEKYLEVENEVEVEFER